MLVRCNSWRLVWVGLTLLPACSPGREAATPAQPTPPPEAAAAPSITDSSAPGPAPAGDQPTGPKLLTTRAGHALLAINPNQNPYKVNVPRSAVAGGQQFVVMIRVCVSEEGRVANVKILKPSTPLVDEQIPIVVPRWVYRPYVFDGRPVRFCYPMNYRVR